jgi:hypothetical protein
LGLKEVVLKGRGGAIASIEGVIVDFAVIERRLNGRHVIEALVGGGPKVVHVSLGEKLFQGGEFRGANARAKF